MRPGTSARSSSSPRTRARPRRREWAGRSRAGARRRGRRRRADGRTRGGASSTSSTASSWRTGSISRSRPRRWRSDDVELARHARRRRRPARRARAALTRADACEARPRHRAARSRRAHARAEEAARPPGAGQPGARDEPEGEPRAARGRRRRGGAARLRGDGDDRRRRALRAAERDRAPRRLADGSAGRHDAVRRRGAPQPRARDPRPRHLRGDALRLRHRAGVRGRRRHAVVEGVPRRRLRVARRQGALHLGHGLGGADGPRAGPLDALPRGALPGRRPGRRLAGRPERLHLVRGARPLGSRRDARDPRRERARCLARPRGRVRQRRDRVALRDPQDGEAHGPVPPGDGLRHLRLLGHAAARQHVRRRELRRRRPRRVAHDPARLAGGRRDRARYRGRARARARARRHERFRRSSPSSALPEISDEEVEVATMRLRRAGDARPRPRGRRRGRGRAARTRRLRARRRARARPARVRRHRRGGARDAAAAHLRRLPADVGGDRRDGRRPLRGQRPERVRRPRNRLPARGRALGAPAVAPARRRPGDAPRRGERRRSRSSSSAARPASGTIRGEVVVAVGPAFADAIRRTIADLDHRDVLDAVCDGIREGGGVPRLVRVRRVADVAFIAHDGAGLSGSRVALGLQSKGTAVIHRADLQPLDNLELFGMSPLYTLESYRAMGRNAAGYALGAASARSRRSSTTSRARSSSSRPRCCMRARRRRSCPAPLRSSSSSSPCPAR